MLRVLYDGWSLAWQPNSPAAWHLLALLAYRPEDVQAFVALPGPCLHPLPAAVTAQIISTPNTEMGRLGWEQRTLPGLARQLDVRLMHLMTLTPALFGPVGVVVSPTGYDLPWASDRTGGKVVRGHGGLAARLREAMSQGGMTRLNGILWPSDLPAPDLPLAPVLLPPVTHPIDWEKEVVPPGAPVPNGWHAEDEGGTLAGELKLELPETYVLYAGPTGPEPLRRLIEAWNWSAGAIGMDYPLVVAGLNEKAIQDLEAILVETNFADTVHLLPEVSLAARTALMRGAAALFHPEPASPWGGPERPALISGKPVVALETPLSDALYGPAAYLVRARGPEQEIERALGAALITVIVEMEVGEALSQAARQRSTAYQGRTFSQELMKAYTACLKRA